MPECLAPEFDPNGNWGTPSEGFQMSFRLPKTEYVTNEPIPAVLIIRNITQEDLCFTMFHFPADFDILVFRDKQQISRKDEPKNLTPLQKSIRIVSHNAYPYFVHQYTQKKTLFQLREMFDLSVPGDYSVYSTRRVGKLATPGTGSAEVISRTARFRVTATSVSSSSGTNASQPVSQPLTPGSNLIPGGK
jgi:hypothetical protein